jgi:2-polyprenyl-3-methyl-5-hydroxy-6-metoxy-1,4-benzoquinol methylase
MEREAYVADALDRFRVTMALVPALKEGAQVLELGADPFFLTRLLLRRGLQVTCANWFGVDAGQRQTKVIERSPDGAERAVDYDLFNVETDTFPYEDNSFDLVLCCEILEHLPSDPIHMLAEIHRVLRKDSGVLLLTTPNAVRLVNLVHMLRGENVYEQFSGYGAYGRHNREYTVDELRRLLSEAGYRAKDVFAVDVHPEQADWAPGMDAVSLENRGDNLFALATPIGRERWAYNDWLYMSQHAVKPRVVQPGVVMGENGYLQSGGLYSLEQIGGEWARWTGYAPQGTITLSPNFSGTAEINIRGLGPPPAVGKPITLFAEIGGKQFSWQLECNGKAFGVSAAADAAEGPLELRVWTDRTFVPAELGIGGDRRALGVALIAVDLKPG